MNKKILLILCILVSTLTFAEQTGSLTLNQPSGLDSLVYKSKEIKAGTAKTVESQGFRVQIYSSNRSQEAKAGAFETEKSFLEVFPDTHAYVTYTAPFWKVRVGDFATYFEALNFSNTLKDAFPDYATEIFVVKESIKPIYLDNGGTNSTVENATQDIR